METYSVLRLLADSWFLLVMTLMFLGFCLWPFRPSAKTTHEEVAASIFRNDDHPADSPPAKKEA